jgi:hypothetical protein
MVKVIVVSQRNNLTLRRNSDCVTSNKMIKSPVMASRALNDATSNSFGVRSNNCDVRSKIQMM